MLGSVVTGATGKVRGRVSMSAGIAPRPSAPQDRIPSPERLGHPSLSSRYKTSHEQRYLHKLLVYGERRPLNIIRNQGNKES